MHAISTRMFFVFPFFYQFSVRKNSSVMFCRFLFQLSRKQLTCNNSRHFSILTIERKEAGERLSYEYATVAATAQRSKHMSVFVLPKKYLDYSLGNG